MSDELTHATARVGLQLVTLRNRGRWHLVPFCERVDGRPGWAPRAWAPIWVAATTLCGRKGRWTPVQVGTGDIQYCHACSDLQETGDMFQHAPENVQALIRLPPPPDEEEAP